jgi:DNA-binding HxlR family transcriptional regulator
LDLLGDRWTLVVLRDMLLGGKRHFGDLAREEGIATNVLADRLERLERAGVITKERDPFDGRKRRYTVTDRGVDLVPILVELALWGNEHTPGGSGDPPIMVAAREDRDGLVASLQAGLRSTLAGS